MLKQLKETLEGSMNKERHIPEYLTCPLTLDFMEEPVMLSSGFTYEKNDIVRHFEANGKVDPQTREEVDGNLVMNQSIKHATEEFLRHNPWSFEYSLQDNLETVKL